MALHWSRTRFGQQILDSFYTRPELCVFFVIRDRLLFDRIESLNRDLKSAAFGWYSNERYRPDDDGATGSSQSTVSDCGHAEFGMVGLSVPNFIHEKRARDQPTCYLFGRKSSRRYTDLWISQDACVSRTEFALSLKNGCWVIQALSTQIFIDDRAGLTSRMPGFALHPNLGTTVVLDYPKQARQASREIRFEIYCKEPPFFDPVHGVNLPGSAPSVGPSASTMMTIKNGGDAGGDADADDLPSRLHHIEHVSDDKRLVFDAWTCKRHIVQQYEPPQVEAADKYFKLLCKVPDSNHFLCARERRKDQDGILLLTPDRELISCLGEHKDEITLERARILLWTLLKLVAQLHQAGVYHGNINVESIYVESSFDPETIIITDFSKVTDDPKAAIRECYSIFQVIRDMLGPTHPRTSWTGNSSLDRLWLASLDGPDKWSLSVLQACKQNWIDIDGKWCTLPVRNNLTIKCSSRGNVSYLSWEDVKEYLRLDSILLATGSLRKYNAQRHYENAVNALKNDVLDNQISFDDYMSAQSHLEKHHRSFIGSSLVGYLSRAVQQRNSIATIRHAMEFPVPLHNNHGIVNLSKLFAISSTRDRVSLDAYSKSTLEIRGPRNLPGLYVPVSHLPELCNMLQLRISPQDEARLGELQTSDMAKFCTPSWYILAPSEYSELFPVNSASQLVRLGHEEVSIGAFLQDFVLRNEVLDFTAEAEHLESLASLTTYPPREQHSSCHATVSATATVDTDDSLLFRFGRRFNDENQRSEGSQPRVDSWLDKTTGRMRWKGDIESTVFKIRATERESSKRL